MTQADVARHLGVPGVKAHRLITKANRMGVVKVAIDGDVAECVGLERKIMDRFGLTYCQVVPDLHETGLPLIALGHAGATFLQREIEASKGDVIGIGHGRTLATAVENLPRMDADAVKFVSLLGGLTRNYAANPHDVMHRLAAKTNAEAFVMPVPFFANTAGDREVLLAQRGVRDVLEIAASSSLMIVGIGAAEYEAQLVSSGMVERQEIDEVRRLGGVGEVLGYFFNDEGDFVETPLTARTLSLDLDQLENKRIVAIAGGKEKTCAIRSALMSRRLSGLITDECTAHALVEEDSL
ncbi:MAG: sugar-binding transcriptional regulator [Pseudomonadota bacterium]